MTTCEKCGSEKIIPELQIYDQGQNSDAKTHVAFPGNPQATFFKEWVWGELRADVCGEGAGKRISLLRLISSICQFLISSC